MGGLARKATMIDSLSKDNQPYLVIDSGNLFFAKENIDPGQPMTKGKIYAEAMIQGFNIIGCDAFSPGPYDFAGGKDFLMENLYKKALFPFISLNITDLDNELLFDEFVVHNVGGQSVAFIGLTSIFQSPDIIVKEPLKVLDDFFNTNQLSADIIILLGNLTPQDLSKIYNKNYPIDLIMDSKNGKLSSDGGNKNIPTYSLGKKGQRLFAFDITTVSNDNDYVDINWCENTVNYYNGRLNNMKEQVANNLGLNSSDLIDLEKHYRNDSATLKRVKKYMNMIEDANQQLENAKNLISVSKYELGEKGTNKVVPREDLDIIVTAAIKKEKESQHPNMPDHKGRLPGDPHYNHSH